MSTAQASPPATAEPVLITLILKHHAGLVLDDIQSRLKASDWWERFPIAGTRVVSWTVAMGLGPVSYTHLTLPTKRIV